MALFTIWQGDPIMNLDATSQLTIAKEWDAPTLATLMNTHAEKIEQRFQENNEAWVARLSGLPVSFGWLGRERARIGELSKVVDLPKGNVYLWNFRTLEPYRGRGYYVQLLKAILSLEITVSDRIWIISAPENQSSYNGIIKAGFQPVGDLLFNYKNEVVLMADTLNTRTHAGADLLQIPISTTLVRPCWRCVSKAMNKEASCDCSDNNLPCRCKSQAPRAVEKAIL